MKPRIIHNIAPMRFNENYTPPDVVEAFDGLLTCDGVFLNVWTHRHIIRARHKRNPANRTILFPMWNYVGCDNAFDKVMPRELFCDWGQLMDLVYEGCELGSHSWTHRDMTTLNDQEVMNELRMPCAGIKAFAYPYGSVDDRVARLTREAGYEEAYSVFRGLNDKWSIHREYL